MNPDNYVYIWWGFMSAVAVLNMFLLLLTYKTFIKRKPEYSPTVLFVRKFHLVLAAIYVFGCGFRSYLPRGDVRRIVLVDHWISAIAIGRSVATVAELAFAMQWALILYEMGKSTNNKFLTNAYKIIVPAIVIAECFSWYACLTGNYIGTIVEESLWGITAAIAVVGFIIARPLYQGAQRKFLNFATFSGVGYVIYMFTVDVPSYVRGFIANQAEGKVYATVQQGLIEVATVARFTRAYEDWRYEFVWMTLYFSLAVWASMLIVNGPRMDKGLK